MTQPLTCCSCNEPFQTQERIFNGGRHRFHLGCNFDFLLDPEGASLPCDHLARRAVVVNVREDSAVQPLNPQNVHTLENREVEVIPLNPQNIPEEDTEETRLLSCAVICSALGVTVLMIGLLVEATSYLGYES